MVAANAALLLVSSNVKIKLVYKERAVASYYDFHYMLYNVESDLL